MNKKSIAIAIAIFAAGSMFLTGWYRSLSANDELTGSRVVQPGTAVGVNTQQAAAGPTRPQAQRTAIAPDFTLQKLGGGSVTLSDYRGKKPVVLDFWASWCPNCRRDMPKLSRMYDKYKDQVEVIGVNLRESNSTAQNYISSAGISFPIVMDPNGATSNAYGNRYTNTHVLIDKNGNIVRTVPGDIRETDIEWLISQS